MESYVVIERAEGADGNIFFTYCKRSEQGLRGLFQEIWAMARPDWAYDTTADMQAILDVFNERGLCLDAEVVREQDFRAYCEENGLSPLPKYEADFEDGCYIGIQLRKTSR